MKAGRRRPYGYAAGDFGRQLLDLGGQCRDLLLQLGDAAIPLGQLSFQFGDALLIGLFGAGVHRASDDPTEALSDGWHSVPLVEAKKFNAMVLAFSSWGDILIGRRLMVSLPGRKAVNGYVECGQMVEKLFKKI